MPRAAAIRRPGIKLSWGAAERGQGRADGGTGHADGRDPELRAAGPGKSGTVGTEREGAGSFLGQSLWSCCHGLNWSVLFQV